MIDSFNPQEILDIAIKVEENGRKLYESLAKKAGNEKLRGVWNFLKEQEELHRDTFKQILDNSGEYIVNDFSPGEYAGYIRAIASEYVFSPELIELKTNQGFVSDAEAIDFGISIEKDSILVYTALRDYIVLARQETINKIISEEKKHLADLIELKGSLPGDL
jgi:rubrerythrin